MFGKLTKIRIFLAAIFLAVAIAPAGLAVAQQPRTFRWNIGGSSLQIPMPGTLAPAAAPTGMTVVASGLNNPRGLTFGADGALYVAEAGLGGTDPCFTSDEFGTICYGPTGSITRIDLVNGTQSYFATGLPSLGAPADGGFGATGPHDVSPRQMGLDVIIGLGADPAIRDGIPQFSGFGTSARVLYSGLWGFFKDISAYESANNPDGGEVDSNPYSVTHVKDGMRAIADAGGNDLLGMFVNGRVETLAVFPDTMVEAPPFLGLPPGTLIPMQAVPDSVVVGPDGALYVGQLTGFPFPLLGANVFRIAQPGGQPEIFAGGFTNIIDIAFDKDGNLYVLEITHNGLLAAEMTGDLTGALWKVEAGTGNRTMLAMEGLVAPGGLAIGADGSIYISNYSIFPGMGEVVRLDNAAPTGPLPLNPAPIDNFDSLKQAFIPTVKTK